MPKYRDLQSLTKLLETHTPLNSKLKMLSPLWTHYVYLRSIYPQYNARSQKSLCLEDPKWM